MLPQPPDQEKRTACGKQAQRHGVTLEFPSPRLSNWNTGLQGPGFVTGSPWPNTAFTAVQITFLNNTLLLFLLC